MPDVITNPDDPRLADYAHVGHPAWLVERRLFVAEGRLVVRRMIESARYGVRSVLVTPAAFADLAALFTPGLTVLVAAPGIVNAVTGFNFHRGCLALAERPGSSRVQAQDTSLLLAVERIGNPDNLGGLFRVAAAFGAGGVLLSPGCADPFYRKAIRTSMGTVLTMPFEVVESWPEGLRRFAGEGFRIVALTPRRDAAAIGTVRLGTGEKAIVLVGAEGPGLSRAALEIGDAAARIPMAPGVDSLNVTVAAGIALSRLSAPDR